MTNELKRLDSQPIIKQSKSPVTNLHRENTNSKKIFKHRATSAAPKIKTPTSINFVGSLLHENVADDRLSLDSMNNFVQDAVVEYHHDDSEDDETPSHPKRNYLKNKQTSADLCEIGLK